MSNKLLGGRGERILHYTRSSQQRWSRKPRGPVGGAPSDFDFFPPHGVQLPSSASSRDRCGGSQGCQKWKDLRSTSNHPSPTLVGAAAMHHLFPGQQFSLSQPLHVRSSEDRRSTSLGKSGIERWRAVYSEFRTRCQKKKGGPSGCWRAFR